MAPHRIKQSGTVHFARLEDHITVGEDTRVVRILASIALQGTQVIRVAKLGSQLLEDAPVMLADYLANRVTREEAVSRISRRYRQWATIFERRQP